MQTNPAYVRQLMSAMRKGGLLLSVKGHPKPALAREPARISLLDIYRAVEGDKPLLHQDTHTNPACGAFTWTSSKRRKTACARSPCGIYWTNTMPE